MQGTGFDAAVVGGRVGGWVTGDGERVLLLHGGPGLSYEYLDGLAADIGSGYEIAAFQQRGLAPSMTDGPYDIDTHIADVRAVLDALGWASATVVGHSWGGHLALHLATAIPDRLAGVLCVDPLGGVGDGGAALFSAELTGRLPASVREQVRAIEDRATPGSGDDDPMAALRLYWPAYFARWDSAPSLPPMTKSDAAFDGAFASLLDRLPDLEKSLSSIAIPLGIVAGAQSPMPVFEASVLTAERIPGAWVETIDDAGHFPWLEQPGCIRNGLSWLGAP